MSPALSTRDFSLPTLSRSNSLRHEVDCLFDLFLRHNSGSPESAMTNGENAPVSIWDGLLQPQNGLVSQISNRTKRAIPASAASASESDRH